MWHKIDVHISRQFAVNTWHIRLNALNKRILSLLNLNRMKIKCHLLIFHSFTFAWICWSVCAVQLSRAYCKYAKHMANVRIGIFLLLIVDFDTLEISSFVVWLIIIILSNIDRMCYTHEDSSTNKFVLSLLLLMVLNGGIRMNTSSNHTNEA